MAPLLADVRLTEAGLLLQPEQAEVSSEETCSRQPLLARLLESCLAQEALVVEDMMKMELHNLPQHRELTTQALEGALLACIIQNEATGADLVPQVLRLRLEMEEVTMDTHLLIRQEAPKVTCGRDIRPFLQAALQTIC